VGFITSAGEHVMTFAIDQLWHARSLLLQRASLGPEALLSPAADAARAWAWPSGLLLSVGFTVGVTLLAV